MRARACRFREPQFSNRQGQRHPSLPALLSVGLGCLAEGAERHSRAPEPPLAAGHWPDSPPMLFPQASSVRPSTVLLRLKMTPIVLNRLTTSVAAVLIHKALTRKPRKAKACRKGARRGKEEARRRASPLAIQTWPGFFKNGLWAETAHGPPVADPLCNGLNQRIKSSPVTPFVRVSLLLRERFK